MCHANVLIVPAGLTTLTIESILALYVSGKPGPQAELLLGWAGTEFVLWVELS